MPAKGQPLGLFYLVISMGKLFERYFNRQRWRFYWLYQRGKTPWDTNITPPEVMDFIAANKAGRALDLGCGTGTNAISLARHGWQVTGVDFVPKAIRMARAKSRGSGLKVDFHCASVTDLSTFTGAYDYALDIGCLFGLGAEERTQYVRHLERLTQPGACYMLYAWFPRSWKGRMVGLTEEGVEALLEPSFVREKMVAGEEKGFASAWYWYRRRITAKAYQHASVD